MAVCGTINAKKYAQERELQYKSQVLISEDALFQAVSRIVLFSSSAVMMEFDIWIQLKYIQF